MERERERERDDTDELVATTPASPRKARRAKSKRRRVKVKVTRRTTGVGPPFQRTPVPPWCMGAAWIALMGGISAAPRAVNPR